MLRTKVVDDDRLLTITVMRHGSDADYVAHLSSVIDTRTAQQVMTPIMVGEYRGMTRGAAVDGVFAAARAVFGLS
jgi:hypothetical protein